MGMDSTIHWGIWVGKGGGWLRFDSNNIFWTTSRAVAQAQMEAVGNVENDGLEVRSFDSMLNEKEAEKI